MKVTGYSREQVFRLIRQYGKTGRLDLRACIQGQKFTRRYTASDIRLLAAMDERHNTPNGLAVKKLCERACHVFGQQEYARLATISVSHLYNLRRSPGYRRQRTTLDKTRSRPSSIGERRKPQPQDRPGYIRVDTVHQRQATETITLPPLHDPCDKLKSIPQAHSFLKPGGHLREARRLGPPNHRQRGCRKNEPRPIPVVSNHLPTGVQKGLIPSPSAAFSDWSMPLPLV